VVFASYVGGMRLRRPGAKKFARSLVN
jgi:hypothetical protein